MRRTMWIGVLLLAILAGVAIGVGAYHAGVNHGLTQAGRADQVVRVVEPGGFFPFGLFPFPLFFFGFFFLARAAFWGRRGGGPGGPWRHSEHWSNEGPDRLQDWHRRQHEQQAGDHPSSGGEPMKV